MDAHYWLKCRDKVTTEAQPQQDFYINPSPKSQGTSWKRGRKDVKNQSIERTCVK